jgi:hypothetical protein
MVRTSLEMRQPNAFKEAGDRYGMVVYAGLMGSGHANLGVGSLVRVGPNELVTDDPEVLRKMMAVRSVCVRRYEKKTDLV